MPSGPVQAPKTTSKTPSKETQPKEKNNPEETPQSRDDRFLKRAQALLSDLQQTAKDLNDTYYTSAMHACKDVTVHLQRRIHEVGKLRR